VMLYQCVTGKTPYSGANFVELAEQHLRAPVPSATAVQPDLPVEIDIILQRALAKSPDERYPSCLAMKEDLEQLLQAEAEDISADTAELPVVAHALALDEPTPTFGPVPIATPQQHRRSRPSAVGLLALLVLVAGGTSAFLLARSSGAPSSTSGGGAGDSTQDVTSRFPSTASVTQTPRPRPKPLVAVRIASASTLDPSGDGTENAGSAPMAIDGSASTLWSTETYKGTRNVNGKPGVGLVLDLSRVTDVNRLRLITTEAGWSGRIYETTQTTAPPTLAGWQAVSRPFTMNATRRTIPLNGPPARQLLIWITNLTGPDGEWSAKIAEATPLVQKS
jgi:hypothetical protein